MPAPVTRNLLEKIVPEQWDSQAPSANSGFQRARWLQGLNDLLNRPVLNRTTNQTSGTAVTAGGAPQSTGVGTPNAMQPKRYAEFTVKARVTYNANSTGPVYLYVYRTLGSIPALGAAPNAGDVIVGGDAFTGGPTVSGVNQSASFSFLDSGLSVNAKYNYYFAVMSPAASVVNLVNSSQLLVMERS